MRGDAGREILLFCIYLKVQEVLADILAWGPRISIESLPRAVVLGKNELAIA